MIFDKLLRSKRRRTGFEMKELQYLIGRLQVNSNRTMHTNLFSVCNRFCNNKVEERPGTIATHNRYNVLYQSHFSKSS